MLHHCGEHQVVVGRGVRGKDNRIDLLPAFIDQDRGQAMSYRVNGVEAGSAHRGAYRVMRAAVLAMIVVFALLFFAYAALSIASLFLWSLS